MRPIVYGMPDLEFFDFQKYAVGGCCMSPDGNNPVVQCGNCEWKGFRQDLSASASMQNGD